MVVKADQERVKTLLKDTITLLCRNGLTFKSQFCIEALIGVTLDDDDVFLVSIKELIKSEKAHVKPSSDHHIHHDSDSSQKKPNKSTGKDKPRERGERDRERLEREKERERERDRAERERERDRVEREREKVERERADRERAEREKDKASRDREPKQHKRKHHEIKEEEETSEDEDYDEPEEGEIRIPFMQKKPPDMWDDEEENPSFDESSSQSFPPITEPLLPKREASQHVTPIKQARVVAQPRNPPPNSGQSSGKGSGQGSGLAGQGSGLAGQGTAQGQGSEIVFIKEEPDDGEGSWGPHEEDEELDEEDMHESMFQTMGDERHFGNMSGMNLVPVNSQEQSAMMSSVGPWQQHPQRQQFHSRRTATVTSEGQQQDGEHAEMPPPGMDMSQGQDPSQDLENSCFYDVCDYDDEYEMDHEMDEDEMDEFDEMEHNMAHGMNHGMSHEMSREMAEEMGAEMGHGMTHEMTDEMSHIMGQDMHHDMSQDEMKSVRNTKSAAKKSRTPASTTVQTTMFFCPTCNQSFTSLSMYNRHKDEHKGIFKHQCSECKKGFGTKGKLETHMRQHTGERFLCTLCGRGLASKTSLKRHIKSMHEGKEIP